MLIWGIGDWTGLDWTGDCLLRGGGDGWERIFFSRGLCYIYSIPQERFFFFPYHFISLITFLPLLYFLPLQHCLLFFPSSPGHMRVLGDGDVYVL